MKRLALLVLILVACKDVERAPEPKPAEPSAAEATGEPARAKKPLVPSKPVLLPEPPAVPEVPLGLPERPSPAHNPTTPAKVELGRLLFFDARLSANGSMKCASCHDPDLGWADGKALSMTVAAALNQRHTPTLFNVGYHEAFYWDGRMPTMEAMILSNWQGQMGAEPRAVAARLAELPVYAAHFQRAFGAGPSPARIAEALAAFVRTIHSGGAPWDRYEAGDESAVSAEVIAGAAIYRERAGCATCHPPPLYTDLGYHDRGVPQSEIAPDSGRFRVTGDEEHRGAFKTPGLRGLVHTAPYFHNGSAVTLDEVLDVELAASGVELSAVERRQLEAFLRALSVP